MERPVKSVTKIDIAGDIFIALELKIQAYQRGFAEELPKALWLMRFTDKLFILFIGIITTPSLPCRVMRCGPWRRASRNTSLKRALAV